MPGPAYLPVERQIIYLLLQKYTVQLKTPVCPFLHGGLFQMSDNLDQHCLNVRSNFN